MRKYPRIHSTRKYKKPSNLECEACQEKAVGTVMIEFTWMRGEDESYKVCQRHMSMANSNLDKFFVHCETKDQWVEKQKPGTCEPGLAID